MKYFNLGLFDVEGIRKFHNGATRLFFQQTSINTTINLSNVNVNVQAWRTLIGLPYEVNLLFQRTENYILSGEDFPSFNIRNPYYANLAFNPARIIFPNINALIADFRSMSLYGNMINQNNAGRANPGAGRNWWLTLNELLQIIAKQTSELSIKMLYKILRASAEIVPYQWFYMGSFQQQLLKTTTVTTFASFLSFITYCEVEDFDIIDFNFSRAFIEFNKISFHMDDFVHKYCIIRRTIDDMARILGIPVEFYSKSQIILGYYKDYSSKCPILFDFLEQYLLKNKSFANLDLRLQLAFTDVRKYNILNDIYQSIIQEPLAFGLTFRYLYGDPSSNIVAMFEFLNRPSNNIVNINDTRTLIRDLGRTDYVNNLRDLMRNGSTISFNLPSNVDWIEVDVIPDQTEVPLNLNQRYTNSENLSFGTVQMHYARVDGKMITFSVLPGIPRRFFVPTVTGYFMTNISNDIYKIMADGSRLFTVKLEVPIFVEEELLKLIVHGGKGIRFEF